MRSTDDEGLEIWVRTVPGLDGTYHMTLEIGPDRAQSLTKDEALAWAQYVMAQIASAAHDAALLTLAQGQLEMESGLIGTLIGEVRQTRPKHAPPAGIPLSISPGATIDGKPFLHLHLDGQTVGQWEVTDGFGHITGVLMALATQPLDESLYATLLTFGVSGQVAMAVIHEMGHFALNQAD